MNLCIATPLRGADTNAALVTFGYATFLSQLAGMMKIQVQVGFCLDVVRSRNRIASYILTHPDFENVEYVLWVDDDMHPERVQIVLEMIKHAEESGAGIVAAPYTNKRKPLRWTHRVSGSRVLGVGFGFTLMTREALQKVWDDCPTGEIYVDMPGGLQCRNMFGQVYDQIEGVRTLLSEDYSFCRHALDAGVKIELHVAGGLIFHSGSVPFSAEDM